MICRLTVKQGVATLGDDFLWASDNRVLASMLNQLFSPLEDAGEMSPSGPLGSRQAASAAKELNGTIEWLGVREIAPDRVY